MKRIAMAMLMCLLVTCGICLGQQQPAPTDNGVYLQNGTGWDKLYVASISGVKASGAAKVMFSYGIASARSVMLFRDATAPIKTASMRPIFLVIGSNGTAPRDIVIVRLQQKKDHRELSVGKANAYTGMKMEYSPADVTEVDVKDSKEGRLVTPRVDLTPGEYIIFAGSPSPLPNGYGGCDFSVVPSK